jgi:hypothetical protein
MILRRLYIYLVSAVALLVLAIGLVFLGTTILLFVFNDPSAEYSRTSLAGFTAATVVALPVWAIHFWFAGRFAKRDAAERSSALRRLYVYWACLITALGGTTALSFTLGHLVAPLVDTCTSANTPPCSSTPGWLLITQGAWATVVLLALWAFHIQIALRDRAIAGEQGASATLRRWYMYIALLAGLLTLLVGASSLIERVWLQAMHSSLLNYLLVSDAAGQTVGGLALWGFHAWLLSTRYAQDDRQSTLRALEGFIAVAVSIAAALVGASQIFYYALARALGVPNPGNVGSDVLASLSGPMSAIVVYGTAWVLVRRRLARDAGTEEAARQAAIRRLYTNLVALVSLAAMAIGAGGVLWTLAEQLEAPIIGVKTADWKDPISLWLTLLVVGAAVWFAHWRPAPWAADRQSLSRKLYLWAALLASVLAVLGYGIFLLYAVLQQAFQPHPRLNDPANLDFGHYLAAVLVAVVGGVYHWRVMRADSAARPARAEIAAAPAAAAPATATVPAAAAPTPTAGRRFVLSVVGATEDDVHQALAALPPQASYKLTSADQTR